MANKSNFNSTSVNLNLKTYTVSNLNERTKLQDLSSNYQKKDYEVYNNQKYDELQGEILTLDKLKEEARKKSELEELKKEQIEINNSERDKANAVADKIFDGIEKVDQYLFTVTASFTTGALEVFENIGDGLLMAGGAIVSGVSSLFGEKEFAEDVKNWTSKTVAYDWTEEIYNRAVDYYDIDEEIAYGAVHDLASIGGTMVGYVALTAATGGIGATASTSNILAIATSTTTGTLSAMGSSSEQALKNGSTFKDTLLVGGVAGVLGGISGGLLNKLQGAAKSVNSLSKYINVSVKSVISSTLEPVLNSVTEYKTYGKDLIDENGENLDFFDYYTQSGGLLNTFVAGVIGFATSSSKSFSFKDANRFLEAENYKSKINLNGMLDIELHPELSDVKNYSQSIEIIKQKFSNAFQLNYAEDPSARKLINSMLDLIEKNEFLDDDVKYMIENLDKIKKYSPDFKILIRSFSAFDSNSTVIMNEADLDFSKAIFPHEITHALYNYGIRSKSIFANKLSDANISALEISKNNMLKNESKVAAFLTESIEKFRSSILDANLIYKKFADIDAERITSTIDDLYKNNNMSAVRAELSNVFFKPSSSVKKILVEAGLTISDIDDIKLNQELTTKIIIQQKKFDSIISYSDKLNADYDIRGDYRRISTMIDSLTQSDDRFVKINLYGHGKKYWESKSTNVYDELLADYVSLSANGRKEALTLLEDLAGKEIFDDLRKTIKTIVDEMKNM